MNNINKILGVILMLGSVFISTMGESQYEYLSL